MFSYEKFSHSQRRYLQQQLHYKQRKAEMFGKKSRFKMIKSIDEFKWHNRKLKGDAQFELRKSYQL